MLLRCHPINSNYFCADLPSLNASCCNPAVSGAPPAPASLSTCPSWDGAGTWPCPQPPEGSVGPGRSEVSWSCPAWHGAAGPCPVLSSLQPGTKLHPSFPVAPSSGSSPRSKQPPPGPSPEQCQGEPITGTCGLIPGSPPAPNTRPRGSCCNHSPQLQLDLSISCSRAWAAEH